MASVTTKKMPAFEVLLSEREAVQLREMLEYLSVQALLTRVVRDTALLEYLLDNLPEA